MLIARFCFMANKLKQLRPLYDWFQKLRLIDTRGCAFAPRRPNTPGEGKLLVALIIPTHGPARRDARIDSFCLVHETGIHHSLSNGRLQIVFRLTYNTWIFCNINMVCISPMFALFATLLTAPSMIPANSASPCAVAVPTAELTIAVTLTSRAVAIVKESNFFVCDT